MSDADLTEEEVDCLLESSDVPEEIRQFAVRSGDIGVRTSAYAKIAAAAKAEADALLSVRMLAAVQGELTDLAEARKAAITAESTVKQLRGVVDEKDHQIEQLMAGPAMAVHSED